MTTKEIMRAQKYLKTLGGNHKRGKLWKAMRILRNFNCRELMTVCEQTNIDSVRTYVSMLHRVGYLRMQRTGVLPKGIDPGFEYAPGRARLISSIPAEKPINVIGTANSYGLPNMQGNTAMPTARAFKGKLLPDDLDDEAYVTEFLKQVGISGEEGVVRDPIGERIVIGRSLFEKKSGALKSNKRNRGRFMPLLAKALLDPDEIWVRIEALGKNKALRISRRYVSQFYIEGEEKPFLAVFERSADGWFGVTTFQGEDQNVKDWRVGVRLYRRKE